MLHPQRWTTHHFRRHAADAELICQGCGHRKILKPYDLEQAFGVPTLLTEAIHRFRCERCQRKLAKIAALFRRR
jgi:DNA-directed RNA polymerase subunit RPC12/RpoP